MFYIGESALEKSKVKIKKNIIKNFENIQKIAKIFRIKNDKTSLGIKPQKATFFIKRSASLIRKLVNHIIAINIAQQKMQIFFSTPLKKYTWGEDFCTLFCCDFFSLIVVRN